MPDDSRLERRRDQSRRKTIAETPLEELRRQALTCSVTGLPNGRAFDEDEQDCPSPYFGASEIEDLGDVRRDFGSDALEQLLQAKACVLLQVGLRPYLSLVEFTYRGDSAEEMAEKFEQAREIFRKQSIAITDREGNARTLSGRDFYYGTGRSVNEAFDRLSAQKRQARAQSNRR